MNITPEKINIHLRSISDIPLQIEIGTQQAEINWGDGSSTQLKNPAPHLTLRHSYTKSATIRIEINGIAIRSLSVPQLGILDLEFQNCPHLEYLNCAINEIEELNLQQCPQLEELYCDSNHLKKLEVSGLIELTQLITAFNELEALNLKDCNRLQVLDCSNNQLHSLLFTESSQLHSLAIQNNLLDEAALSQIFRQLPCKKNNGILNYTNNPGFPSVSSLLFRKKNWTT